MAVPQRTLGLGTFFKTLTTRIRITKRTSHCLSLYISHSLLWLVLISTRVLSQEPTYPYVDCLSSSTAQEIKIAFAGDEATSSIVDSWKLLLEDLCPYYNVEVIGNTSTSPPENDNDPTSSVARMLCGPNLVNDETPFIDVNGMSRNWDETIDNVTLENPYTYACKGSNREIAQLVIGYEVAALVVARNSAAAECLASLLQPTMENGGLTIHQVRWIWSSFSVPQLSVSSLSWTPNSITSSNRTWNALNRNAAACSSQPIVVASAITDSSLYDFVQNQLFDTANGEGFASDRNHTSFESFLDLADFIQSTHNAIGMVNYADLASHYTDLMVVPIQNPLTQIYVVPDESTYSISHDYNHTTQYQPLSRPLYVNVLTNDSVYERFRPLLEVGFSLDGDQALRTLGKVPVSLAEKYAGRAKVSSPFVPDRRDVSCGNYSANMSTTFSIAGSTSAQPICSVWAAVFQVYCPDIVIAESYKGSLDAATRVCNKNLNSEQDDGDNNFSADIGIMSRQWDYATEAVSLLEAGDWMLECVGTSRRVIQLSMALDGLTLAFFDPNKNWSVGLFGDTIIDSNAKNCIDALGGALTRDQLRWMYTSLSEEELLESGWDRSLATPNADNDPETRRWRELLDDIACVDEDILMTVSDAVEGSTHSLTEYLFNHSMGETFDFARMTNVTGISYSKTTSEKETINYILSHGNAVGLIAYSEYELFGYPLAAAKLPDIDGLLVSPSRSSIESGVYPLIRRLYMNLLDSTASLEVTRPFVQFALSAAGQQLVDQVGSHHLTSTVATIMQTRAQTDVGIPLSKITESSHLGCATGGFSISGSSTVFPIAEIWAGIYEVGCDIDIRVSGGGSGVGAHRVCATGEKGTPVEIGDLSRDWQEDEAMPREEGSMVYQCGFGNTSRSVIQCRVAIDDLTIVVAKGGVADECIQILGGLTVDQLRWMYSNASDTDLMNDKTWDPNSVPNSDNNQLTHLWSELDRRCARQEIQISGADDVSGTYQYFKEVVFPKDSYESFDLERPAPYVNHAVDQVLVAYLAETPSGISFFGYAYFYTRQDVLTPVPIMNPETGRFVVPDKSSLHSDSYKPFARPIYMNLLNDPYMLKNMYPFLQFGYSEEGAKLVEQTGYHPVSARVIYDTLNLVADEAGLERPLDMTAPPSSAPPAESASSDDRSMSTGAIIGIALGVCVLVIAVFLALYMRRRSSEPTNDSPAGKTEESGMMKTIGSILQQPALLGSSNKHLPPSQSLKECQN